MTPSPEAVLADLPEWTNAEITKLTGGLTNHAWLIRSGERRAVLKIDESPREAPFNSRRAEAQIQTSAATQGLANRVLLATDTVYMTEYVHGVIWSPRKLQDSASLETLAVALRSLHSLPLTGRTFDAIGAARNYARRIGGGQEPRIRECLDKIAAGPRPHNLCLCHNDLVVGNILHTPAIRFLDWEYACDNDPFFDLATIVAHHGLDETRTGQLLDAYFDGDGQRWRDQLSRQAEVYDALLWLWSAARAQRDTQRSQGGHGR